MELKKREEGWRDHDVEVCRLQRGVLIKHARGVRGAHSLLLY